MYKKIWYLLFFNLLWLSGPVINAQDSILARRYITDLASSSMYGRGYSYQGDSIAAAYIRQQFTDLNIKPLGDNYYQSYQFPAFAMEGEIRVSVNEKQLDPFTAFRIYPFSRSIQQNNIPVIYFDPAMLLDDRKLDRFLKKNQKKFRDHFVVIDMVNYRPKESKDLQTVNFLLEMMKIGRSNIFSSPGLLITTEELPVIGLSMTHYERDYALIYAILPDQKKIKTLDVFFSNKLNLHQTQNIAAIVPGKLEPDSFIVFTAHYDHIGSMGETVIFPGAHDNASGTATVMNLAKYYHENPAPYSMIFLLFSGEEAGLRGSAYFVNDPLIELNKIKLLVNIDMFCGGDDGIVVVNGKEAIPGEFYEILVTTNLKSNAVPEVKNRSNTANSDHYPFTQKDVPALFIYTIGGGYGGYHEYTDTGERCSLSKWEDLVKLLISATEEFMRH